VANALVLGEGGIMITYRFMDNSINRRGFGQVAIFLALRLISSASAALVVYLGYLMFQR
jgi:hypothetical protein